MNWLAVKTETTGLGIDLVISALKELGLDGFEIEDEAEFFEFIEENAAQWDYVDEALAESKKGKNSVTVYLEDGPEGRDLLSLIKTRIAALKEEFGEITGSLNVTATEIRSADWENNWKKYYKPIEVGENILILPEWEPLPKRNTRSAVFKIDPGILFGTGSHETTKLCLEAIEKNVSNGDTVFDLGCGSGILGLTALILGAKRAVLADIDDKAIETVAANGDLNGIEKSSYEVFAANVLTDEPFCKKLEDEKCDVLVANIVADVLIALSKKVSSFVKDGGIFIASGIIDTRLDDVVSAFEEADLIITSVEAANGWRAVICRV